jgi:hypothetical protein
LFSSGGLKFICICGNKNDPQNEYCEVCGKNICGITQKQKHIIDQFNDWVETLSEIMK